MLYAVVMAGGSGTRFWPKSRRSRPKQLLKLFGDHSMIQQTVHRVAPMVPPERTLVITGADQALAIRDQLPEVPEENIIAEPCPRDTAPCVGLAASVVRSLDPDGSMIVMPADHVIRPDAVFQRTAKAALSVIDSDPSAFVTFGVVPTRPEIGYGYIERGEKLGEPEGIGRYKVAQFREKPDRSTAEKFLEDGRFFWNAGIFVWKASAVLDALAKHRPGLSAALERVAETIGTPAAAATLAMEFPRMEKIPIDKAVMEKYHNVQVLEVQYDWSDVGDWRSLAEILPTDPDGNTVQGPTYLVQTSNSVIISDEGKLVATLGLDDVVVIQSGGATLVARRDQLDKLKTLVSGLDEAGFGEYL